LALLSAAHYLGENLLMDLDLLGGGLFLRTWHYYIYIYNIYIYISIYIYIYIYSKYIYTAHIYIYIIFIYCMCIYILFILFIFTVNVSVYYIYIYLLYNIYIYIQYMYVLSLVGQVYRGYHPLRSTSVVCPGQWSNPWAILWPLPLRRWSYDEGGVSFPEKTCRIIPLSNQPSCGLIEP